MSGGNDAILTIQNGQNGIKNVQLTDGDASSFMQNINILDNAGNNKITLGQDGYILATDSLVVGDDNKTSIEEGAISIGNIKLVDNSNSLNVSAVGVSFGSVGSTTDVNVYGGLEITGTLKTNNEINFNDRIICNVSVNGIDFVFNEES